MAFVKELRRSLALIKQPMALAVITATKQAVWRAIRHWREAPRLAGHHTDSPGPCNHLFIAMPVTSHCIPQNS